jgi:D-amino-acid dehydrogenase
VIDSKVIAALEPDVTADVAGGVYFSKDCHLSPNRFLAGLKRQCDALGVKFVWEAEVNDWRVERDRQVYSIRLGNGEELSGDEFVVAGGSWSPVLAQKLGLKIPLQAGKGYSLTLAKPRELPQICTILTEARVAVTPMGRTLRFGGTMEIAGLNEDINSVRVRGIVKAATKYYPAFQPEDFAGIRPWCGLRPCAPDGLPYLGRTARYSNLSIATGHAMMGLSLGPITGRILSEVLSGEQPSFDLTLLNPDRYA